MSDSPLPETVYDDAPLSARALEREAEERVPYHLRPGAGQRRVVCAANRILPQVNTLAGGVMVLAPRHFHPLMHQQIAAFVAAGVGTKAQWRAAEQGFIDNWGQWMTREEAFQVATAAGQVLYGPHLGRGQLDSSDIY